MLNDNFPSAIHLEFMEVARNKAISLSVASSLVVLITRWTKVTALRDYQTTTDCLQFSYCLEQLSE